MFKVHFEIEIKLPKLRFKKKKKKKFFLYIFCFMHLVDFVCKPSIFTVMKHTNLFSGGS